MKTRIDLSFNYPVTIYGARDPESGYLTFIGTNQSTIEKIAMEMCDGTRGTRTLGSVKILQIAISEVTPLLTSPAPEKCPKCGGDGGQQHFTSSGDAWIPCPACYGTGWKVQNDK